MNTRVLRVSYMRIVIRAIRQSKLSLFRESSKMETLSTELLDLSRKSIQREKCKMSTFLK